MFNKKKLEILNSNLKDLTREQDDIFEQVIDKEEAMINLIANLGLLGSNVLYKVDYDAGRISYIYKGKKLVFNICLNKNEAYTLKFVRDYSDETPLEVVLCVQRNYIVNGMMLTRYVYGGFSERTGLAQTGKLINMPFERKVPLLIDYEEHEYPKLTKAIEKSNNSIIEIIPTINNQWQLYEMR